MEIVAKSRDSVSQPKNQCELSCFIPSSSSPFQPSKGSLLFLCGMLRTSTIWANHQAKRACSSSLRAAYSRSLKPLHYTSAISPFKNARSYTSPPSPTPKGKKWSWVIVPALAIGAGYIITKKSEEDNIKDERFDTQKLYSSKTTAELAFSWVILKLCSYDFIVNYGPKLLQVVEQTPLSGIANWAMKQTFFKHFIAGETLEETEQSVKHLKKEGMGVVLDYSIETGSGTTEELDKIAQDI